MSTWFINATLSNSSDSNFCLWVGRIIAALTSCGMVQTDDTNQINPETVSVPTTINTYAGSAIFRFDDSLQATTPIFFKLDFGTGATVGYPALRLSVGSGSNGTGSLTSTWLYNQQILGTWGSTVAGYPWYASGGSGRVSLSFCTGSPQAKGVFCIERGRDESANPVADDVRVLASITITPYWVGAVNYPSSNYIFGPIFPLASAPSSRNGSFNNNVALYPIRIASPAETSPLVGIAAYFAGNITAGYTITVRGWDGADHVYMPTGSYVNASPTYGGSTVVAVLYE